MYPFPSIVSVQNYPNSCSMQFMVVSINVLMLVIILYVKWDILIIGKTITVTKPLISHSQVIHISRIFSVLENKLFPKKSIE